MVVTTASSGAPIPATDPFTTVAAHFGMLLGVSDLEAVIGHAWAKMRLHNAWLHGQGVVWGGGVSVDADSREVRVEPFLALDGLGHELTIATTSCVDLSAWYAANSASVTNRGTDGVVKFDAVVVAHFRACLDKPVPTLISPCDGSSAGTEYSRLHETAELFLLPADSPDVPARVDHYPRLRLLRGLPSTVADPERTGLLTQAAAVSTAADPGQAWLTLLRNAAAADVVERHPSTGPGDDPLYDASEPAYVVLASVTGLTLSASTPRVAGVETIESGARISQVDTATLVDLAAAPGTPGGAAADAGGPRVVAGSLARAGDTVTFELTAPVVVPTLVSATSIYLFDPAAGWSDAGAGAPTLAGTTVTAPLTAGLDPVAVLRVVVAGSGPVPAVGPPGADGRPVPLAGVTGGPPGTADVGVDAVLTIGGAV